MRTVTSGSCSTSSGFVHRGPPRDPQNRFCSLPHSLLYILATPTSAKMEEAQFKFVLSTTALWKIKNITRHHGFVLVHLLARFPQWDPTSTAPNVLPVSVDAAIAITFGLAGTFVSLITIYIMWKDRSARRNETRSGEYLNSFSGSSIKGRSIGPFAHSQQETSK